MYVISAQDVHYGQFHCAGACMPCQTLAYMSRRCSTIISGIIQLVSNQIHNKKLDFQVFDKNVPFYPTVHWLHVSPNTSINV